MWNHNSHNSFNLGFSFIAGSFGFNLDSFFPLPTFSHRPNRSYINKNAKISVSEKEYFWGALRYCGDG